MKIIDEFRDTMSPPVFLGAVAIIVAFVIYGSIFTERAEQTFNSVQASIVTHFGWFYILSATGLLFFVIWLALSRFGGIRLGGDDAVPEFAAVQRASGRQGLALPVPRSAGRVTTAKISPRSGVAFRLRQGQTLRIIDPEGLQVSDLLARWTCARRSRTDGRSTSKSRSR